MSTISKKICLVGDFAVGKTSLIRRFVEDKFSDDYLSTVGVKVSRKVVDLSVEPTSKQIQLLIWDIEGQTKFKSILPSYLKGASGAIIVADLTRLETMEHLQEHLELFFTINPQSLAIITLNKSDLVTSERLNQLLELYSHQNNYPIIATYPTSAKTGAWVNELFTQLATVMTNPI
jgi:small GTP-binding protein